MQDLSSRSLSQASGVRALTLILVVLLFATAEVYFQTFDPSSVESVLSSPRPVPVARPQTLTSLLDEHIAAPLLEKAPPEKKVPLSEVAVPEPKILEIPAAEKKDPDPKKLDYNFGIKDSTGRGNVRASNAIVGVNYKISERSVLGVEASQEIHDTGDAVAWGRSVDDETAARAKYKLVF